MQREYSRLYPSLVQSIGCRLLRAGLLSTSPVQSLSGSILAGGDITSTTGLVRLDRNSSDLIGNISAGGNIFAGGGILASGASRVIAAGNITAPGVIAGTLTADSSITIDNSANEIGIGVLANTITASPISFINTSIVGPNYVGNGGNAFSPHDFSMTVGSISSSGPAIPILFAIGLNANA